MHVLLPALRRIAAADHDTRDTAVVTFYGHVVPRLTVACDKLLRRHNFEGGTAEDLALDAIHDSLDGLVSRASDVGSDAAVIGYLLGTARHHLTRHMRQSGGATRIRLDRADDPCLMAVVHALSPSHVPTGRDAIILAAYRAAKALLTPAQRAMAEGVLELGQPVDVLATQLHVSRRTGYRRLREALTTLQGALRPLVQPVLRPKAIIAPRPIRPARPRRMAPVTMSLGPAPRPRP